MSLLLACTKQDALENTGTSYFIKLVGTSGTDELGQIIQLQEGYALVGTTTGSSGYKDVLVGKYDQYGNEIWQNTYGGEWDDEGLGMLETETGDLIICGSSMIKQDTVNAMLMKISAAGQELWTKTYGYETSKQVARAITLSHSGGYAFVGFTTASRSNAENQIENPLGQNDIYFGTTDSEGNLIYEKSRGGSESDIGNDIIQSTTGGYLITGTTGSFSNQSQAGNNMIIIHTNSRGDERAQTTYGSSGNDEGNELYRKGDNFYVVGTKEVNGLENIWLIKFEGNNVISDVWEKEYDDLGQTQGYGIGGHSWDEKITLVGSTFNTAKGTNDACFLQVNGEGELIEEPKVFGADGDEIVRSVVSTTEGGFILAGTSLVEFTQMITIIKTKGNGDIE
ncbi:MAG: hypothetical protein GY827_06625 [Cytophagales bacterium]|nr:hypothetical protein [Cytophagales bacterium]